MGFWSIPVLTMFPAVMTVMFQHVLTTTCFQWNVCLYEERDGTAMWSPLSPVTAYFTRELR